LAFAVEIHDSPAALEREWEELAGRVGADPFMRPGWISAWWNAFGSGALRLVGVRRDGRLSALAPLVTGHEADRSTANAQTPLFRPLAEDADAAQELGRSMLDLPAKRLVVQYVEKDDLVRRAIVGAARDRRRPVLERPLQRSPYIALDGDFDSYLAGLDPHYRSELRRRRRRLEEKGQMTVDVLDGREGLAELLDEGFALEASGWKAETGTSIVSRGDTRRFYLEVARWAAREQTLRLAFLRLGGRALAFDYSLEQNGVHYLLKTGFDAARGNLAPGRLLREHMIKRAFEGGLSSYEFLGQDDPWKLKWTPTLRELDHVEVFPRSPAGVARWAVAARAKPLVKAVFRRR